METPFPDASASTLIRLPLSFGQEQLWFLAQLSPTDTTYNVGKAFRLSGSLDTTVLSRSLGYLVERHECLRASFGAVDGTPFQVIRPAAEVELARTDLRAVAGGDAREHALNRALPAEATTPFDLESGPLCRFQLIQLGADDHVLVLSVHHIVTDGWSMGVLTRELSAAYRAFAAGREPDLAAPALGYADHVERQRAEYDSGGWEIELKYWQRQLENLPVLELPGDRLRPAASSNDGGVVRARLSAELVDALRALGSDHGVSLFMILAAALNVVLSRYTGQEDIPVGVPVLGRMDPDLEDVVGLFVNIAVLRTDLSGDPTFAEVVQRVAEANLDLYDNQEVPFHCVVERVAPVRDASRNPLFGVSIQVLGGDTSGVGLALHGVSVTPVAVAATKSRFDLTFKGIARTWLGSRGRRFKSCRPDGQRVFAAQRLWRPCLRGGARSAWTGRTYRCQARRARFAGRLDCTGWPPNVS
jgi:hypothetical protein